jgi:hypothetical protein
MFCDCGGDRSPDEPTEPILAGLLLKRNRWRWVRRRAVLRRGRLSIGAERLDLTDAKLEDVDEPGRHTFCIDDHVFRCDTAREKRRWLRDVARASGAARPPPRPAPAVHGILLKQGQHGLWNRRSAELRSDAWTAARGHRWRLEWSDADNQKRPGGRVDVRNATIAPGENDDTFVVNDVRFKGLAEGDAERWLACLGAARRGASRQDVARIWAPVDEERDVRGGSSGGALVVVLVSCVVLMRPQILLAVLRYVLLPLLLVFVNAYVFRRALVRLATRNMPLRRPPSLDLAIRGAALQVTLTDIVYEDPALLDDDSDAEDDDDEAQKDPLLALETIVVSIVVRRVGKSRRLRAEVCLPCPFFFCRVAGVGPSTRHRAPPDAVDDAGLRRGHGPHALLRDLRRALPRHQPQAVPGRGRGRVRRGRAASLDEAPVTRLPRRPLPEFSGKTRRAVPLWRAAPRDHTITR